MANREAYNAYRKSVSEASPYNVYRKEPDGSWYRLGWASDWESYIENKKKNFGVDKIYRVKDRRTGKVIFEG